MARKSALVVSLLVIVPTTAACSFHKPTHYETYKKYVTSDHLKDFVPIDETSASQLAGMLCAPDEPTVGSALDLLTKPLPNGYDTTGIGIQQAGRLAKAYCDNYTLAFVYLSEAVSQRFGPSMVYTIPQ